MSTKKRASKTAAAGEPTHGTARHGVALPVGGNDPMLLRKAVNTLAIVPKSARITTLGRKTYNVLLYQAQDQGLENTVFKAPLESIISGLDFDSNDHALIKKHLRAMVSTTVEWQSPTTGEGSSWHVSGLLAHATLSKEAGQIWVEWSYAVNLKQELLEPTVFARIRLEVISQLRSHASVALYEICTRYKDIGQTARQAWRWWVPVLSGNPMTEKSAKLEYRIFKRDTLKPALAEINTITDIEVDLVEHKRGRTVDELQFRIQPKRQAALALTRQAAPVDLGLIAKAQRLGVGDEVAEAMAQDFGEDALRSGLESLERRLGTSFPEPLRDPVRYLRALMPTEVARATKRAEQQAAQDAAREDLQSPANRETQQKRRARWVAEWTRRQHEKCSADIEALSQAAQQELEEGLLTALRERNAHPSIIKRLATSGWQHPMVRHEMLKYFGKATYGDQWDTPTAEQLLSVAAELGESEVP